MPGSVGPSYDRRYGQFMSSPKPETERPPGLWKPHPDDDADIVEAMKAANERDLLSAEASEAFVRWLEGTGDESWRDELE